MAEVPVWIEVLYRRAGAGHALASGFLNNLTRESVYDKAATQPNGISDLREAALDRLTDPDPNTLALSLVFLSAVGKREDLARVEQFLDSPSDLVRRAAKACRFQLQRRGRTEPDPIS